jgi:RNA 3'-terminal phosphate cyclase-like protein
VARVIEAARGVLNKLLPDVHIASDHVRGAESGNSAGYSLSLVAESNTGVLLSVESTAGGPDAVAGETPEDIGRDGANKLLAEIERGGVVDSTHQPLVLLLMALGPEDVCKVRLGSDLSVQAIKTLQLVKEAFGVVFKIKRHREEEDQGGFSTIVLSCLGVGMKNMSRKIT